MLQNRVFLFALAPRSGFGAIACSSMVFCYSISRYRMVMVASRLLGVATACVTLLLSFAAGHCKSYWSGCIKAAIVICQQIFSYFLNFGACDFPFKLIFQKCIKIVFFPSAQIRFWRCNFSHRCASFVVQSSTGHAGTHFGQALWHKVVLGSSLCKLCSTK